jgi:hypothetical protein
VEISRELAIDLRAELSRIDSRAAAGVVLIAAILVGVVSQAPTKMSIFAVAVAAAILLTATMLLFLMVLLSTPTLPSHRALVGVRTSSGRSTPELKRVALEERGKQLAIELMRLDRPEYYATVAIEINAQVHARERLLMVAFISGTLGVATLALGASWALLLGWR